jgi:hypothetical protein
MSQLRLTLLRDRFVIRNCCLVLLFCESVFGQHLVGQVNPIQISVVALPFLLQANQSERLLVSLANVALSESTPVRNGDVLELHFSLGNGEITAVEEKLVLTSRVFRDGDWIVDTSKGLNPVRLVYQGTDQVWPTSDMASISLHIRPPTYGTVGIVALHVPADGRFGGQEWQITPISIVDSLLLPLGIQSSAVLDPASRLRGSDVGTTQSISRSTAGAVTAFQESDVIGLIQDLNVRAVKGPGFSQSHAAIINDTNQLEGAVGSASDCIHVDGTSGPCGRAGASFVDKEVPSGVVDGINVTFALLSAPLPASSLHLFRNGILLKDGFDYTLSASFITFVFAARPSPGDTILASYRR